MKTHIFYFRFPGQQLGLNHETTLLNPAFIQEVVAPLGAWIFQDRFWYRVGRKPYGAGASYNQVRHIEDVESVPKIIRMHLLLHT